VNDESMMVERKYNTENDSDTILTSKTREHMTKSERQSHVHVAASSSSV